jgi:hypothetical protein
LSPGSIRVYSYWRFGTTFHEETAMAKDSMAEERFVLNRLKAIQN